MTNADFRSIAAKVGASHPASFHLLGATLARASLARPSVVVSPHILTPAIVRGDIVAVSHATGWSVDDLLAFGSAFASSVDEPFAIRVDNGSRLPLRGDALLALQDEPAVVAGGTPRDSWARGIVLEAWTNLGLAKPNLATLQTVQAVGRLEGFYGLATNPEGWAGSWNWGAVQCKHGTPCGDDCFEAVDSHADGKKYSWCFKRYPSALAGATDLVRLLTDKRPSVATLLPRGNLTAIATEMRATHYFEAPADVYASGLLRNAEAIASAMGEPLRVVIGQDEPITSRSKGAVLGAAALWGLGLAFSALTWGQRGHE